MSDSTALVLPGYEHIYSGKVRDLYAPLDPVTGERRTDQVLLVASDRISAFDYVLDTPIPDKGRVLTQLSLWWFDRLVGLENHVVSTDVPAAVAGRAVRLRSLSALHGAAATRRTAGTQPTPGRTCLPRLAADSAHRVDARTRSPTRRPQKPSATAFPDPPES